MGHVNRKPPRNKFDDEIMYFVVSSSRAEIEMNVGPSARTVCEICRENTVFSVGRLTLAEINHYENVP